MSPIWRWRKAHRQRCQRGVPTTPVGQDRSSPPLLCLNGTDVAKSRLETNRTGRNGVCHDHCAPDVWTFGVTVSGNRSGPDRDLACCSARGSAGSKRRPSTQLPDHPQLPVRSRRQLPRVRIVVLVSYVLVRASQVLDRRFDRTMPQAGLPLGLNNCRTAADPSAPHQQSTANHGQKPGDRGAEGQQQGCCHRNASGAGDSPSG